MSENGDDAYLYYFFGPHRNPLLPAGLMQKIAIERVIVVAEKHLFAPAAALT